jgi:hypothetical protein
MEVAQARAARLAGAMYLVTMAMAIFGESVVRGSLIVPGDVTQTAQNIIESEGLFRLGIAMDLVTVTGVLVLLWALYVLLRPVDRNLALLAVFLRMTEVAIHFVATLFSLLALRFLSGAGYLVAFDVNQLHALARLAISVQSAALNLGFLPLGLGSAVFAYLLLRSRIVPRALAAWGVFSSLLLATYALLYVIFPAVLAIWVVMMAPMFVYEVTLGFWLLKVAPVRETLRWRRLRGSSDGSYRESGRIA